jgi:plasmid stabilization system protein ParE
VTDSLPVRLHPRAEDDAAAAYSWYLERNPIIAEIFFAELNSAMDRIAQNPRRWPRMGRSTCFDAKPTEMSLARGPELSNPMNVTGAPMATRHKLVGIFDNAFHMLAFLTT